MFEYLIGCLTFFIIFIFIFALSQNRSIQQKYPLFSVDDDITFFWGMAIISMLIWPVVILLLLFIGFGYLLYKCFSKIIEWCLNEK